MLFEPCTSASRPVSGFARPSDTVARSGIFTACDTSEMRRLSVVYHGASQLLRPAIVLSCFSRQSFTELGAVARSDFIAAAMFGSVALFGSKMNARSLL